MTDRNLIKHFNSLLMFLFGFLSLFLICDLSAAVIVVPPGGNIQTAINGANNGDTIQLSAGVYMQEFQVISKSLNIIGAGENLTTILAPPASTHLTQNFSFGGVTWWCIVMIDNQAAPTSQTVNISDLTVDGNDQQDALGPIYGSSDRFFAIGYHNANGTVERVHTTNTRQTANFNELAGGGIVNASNTGTVVFNINQCLIDFYQRLGIDCRGSALTATISNSTIDRGFVLTPNTATATPNGIQFSGLATGTIENCTVSTNIATVPGASATGILLFGAGSGLMVTANTVNNNDIGIACINNGNNLTITDNEINFTTTPGVNVDEGIVVQDTNGQSNLISNVMNNIPNVNMELISSTNQPFQLMNNQFIGSQTGMIVSGNTTTGPIVTMDGDSFTGTIGYYIQEVAAPNDIWPSTATVSFDGLISGQMTVAEFNQVLTKIFDKHNDPALGLVLDFIPPVPPDLFTLSPPSGPEVGGTLVTLTGSSFISSNTQVFFGAVPGLNVIVHSNTSITVIAPPGTGVVDVTVVTPFGTSPPLPFTYIPTPPTNLPQVTGLSPNFGPESGGNIVTITGSGFLSANTQVFFGTISGIDVVVISDTEIQVVAPPGTGIVDVRVLTPNGFSVITPADQYTYIPPVTPPLPPKHFIGIIKKNKFLNITEYVLKAKWKPSPSPNVVLYRIYRKNKIIAEISASDPLRFTKEAHSSKAFFTYKIVAVSSDNLESKPLKIRILND